MANDIPRLIGLPSALTFDEDVVNAAPQRLDTDVSFTDADFNGGTLSVTGLLAEDRVSLASDGVVRLSGGSVRYNDIVVGSLTGGQGDTLSITFNDQADAAVVEAVIERLTYANVSDNPTLTRTLTLDVVDAAGARALAGFSPTPDAPKDFNGIEAINVRDYGVPTLGDFDGNGSIDLIIGFADGTLVRYERQSDGTFYGRNLNVTPIDVGSYATPALGDLNGDGRLDLVVGNEDGTLRTYLQNVDGSLTQATGTDDPFAGIDSGIYSTAALGDLNGDGLLDLVVGSNDGKLRTYLRNPDGSVSQATGSADPFAGITFTSDSTPTLGDVNGDGRIDLVVGGVSRSDGLRTYLSNADGSFTQATGATDPFAGFREGLSNLPALGDLNGDGRPDLVLADNGGTLRSYTAGAAGLGIRVTVTPVNEAPTASGDGSVAVLQGGNVVLTVRDLTATDPDSPIEDLIYTVTGTSRGYVVAGSTTVASFTHAQLAAGAVSFYQDGSADGTASFTVTVNDGSAASGPVTVTASVRLTSGTPSNDTLIGDANDDVLNGFAGDDRLFGAAGDDVLIGGTGNDLLDGGTGSDILRGDAGDDTYSVDDADDIVAERTDQGTDTVLASISYALTANVENLTLTGTASLAGTGNALSNILNGNTAANVLNGGAGADTLIGLAGNDWYYVDNAGDRVIEAENGGSDRVLTNVSYTLGAGQSIELFTSWNDNSTSAINLTGNELAQTIKGNAGANVLNGGAGADTLIGLAGNDWYYVDNAGDRVIEAENGGSDRVLTNVSYTLGAGQSIELFTSWNDSWTRAINLTGNELAQTIKGNAGDNTLDGGLGVDTLIGGRGHDTFVFKTTLGAGNVDGIVDFTVSTQADHDTIELAQAIFQALSPGDLNAAAFKDLGVAGANVDADDRILYDKTTGALSYDADGSGAATAVQFATLTNKAALSHLDFFVV